VITLEPVNCHNDANQQYTTLYRAVRDAFEGFYSRRQKERDALVRKRERELREFEARQAAEMDAFQQSLQDLAERMRPAGKLVRPKGILSMFS
jgi:hypothetical protein